MGRDMYMHIVKDGQIIKKDIFDGRNSEWFSNMSEEGWDDEYDFLNIKYGISPKANKDIFTGTEEDKKYYNFYYVSVKDFCDWFINYRPDMRAAWVSTYDKWRIENKGYIPEDPAHYLSKDDVIEDMHFVEYINKYDCSLWLYEYLMNNNIDMEADITYWIG